MGAAPWELELSLDEILHCEIFEDDSNNESTCVIMKGTMDSDKHQREKIQNIPK